jgi:hypothetical protein
MATIYLDRPLPVGSALRQATYPPAERLIAVRTRAECPAYLVLQAVGFAMPAPSPAPRCALTAPFHHYLSPQGHRLCIFCGTFPRVIPGGR